MSILKNAIESIQTGVEDYERTDARKSASAVRNIFAGLLLLYKEKLCRPSPDYDKELLIKQNIHPTVNENGEIIFKGKGHKTVDVQNIKERFSNLNVNTDWRRFDDIKKVRNDLEHYYTEKQQMPSEKLLPNHFC
ncbi:hypothetical protein [Chromobacterium sinusclupearum]|uniref:hypothetical protein n=1 Tax=Chromobacterium sinusclupearum TaxID=2077146 RepID=UPI0011AF2985|nr:hypothetical protein [Chromobacterium sinusclupearum]